MMNQAQARPLQCLVREHVNDHPGRSAFFSRAPDQANCVFDPSASGFGVLGALNGLDVFAAMRVAEVTPALPHPGCGFERFYEVDRWRDLPLVGIEIQTNINRLASLQARSFTIALPQWNARGATHRGYRAPICVAVERDLDRSAYFSKYSLGIEGEWDEAAGTFSNDPGSKRF